MRHLSNEEMQFRDHGAAFVFCKCQLACAERGPHTQVCDKYTHALREFNAHVLEDERVSLSIVPVGDGIALCRKR